MSRRLRPTSPEALGLAAVAATLLDGLLAAMIVLAAINAWAPPQDLPWKPLRLADPPGLATGAKLAMAVRDPARCRAVLAQGAVRFAEEPGRSEGFCSTVGAVRLTGGVTRLSPAAPVMSCGEALSYAFWDRHAVQPLAREMLGSEVSRIEHFGTYACRNVYGRSEGRPSQHATADALDVAAFRLADGRTLSVSGHFRAEDARGRFMRAVRDEACRYFGGVLSPDYNAAHADHFHLDQSPWGICR